MAQGSVAANPKPMCPRLLGPSAFSYIGRLPWITRIKMTAIARISSR